MDLPTLNSNVSQYLGKQLLSGDQNALNGQFGYDNARSNYDFQSGGNVYTVSNNGNGTRSVSLSGSVADRLAQKAKSDRLAAIQPAIDSYNAELPEVDSAYATEKTRLQGESQSLGDRYQALLDDINNRETKDTNSQTLVTNNELAKRGLSSDSGSAQQEMQNVLSPILSNYGNIKKQTTLDSTDAQRAVSDAISGLVPKQTADRRSIVQAIANLQANTGNQNVTDFLNLTQQGFENSLASRQQTESEKEAAITDALNQSKLDLAKSGSGSGLLTLSPGQTVYNPNTNSAMYTAAQLAKATGAVSSGW